MNKMLLGFTVMTMLSSAVMAHAGEYSIIFNNSNFNDIVVNGCLEYKQICTLVDTCSHFSETNLCDRWSTETKCKAVCTKWDDK